MERVEVQVVGQILGLRSFLFVSTTSGHRGMETEIEKVEVEVEQKKVEVEVERKKVEVEVERKKVEVEVERKESGNRASTHGGNGYRGLWRRAICSRG